MIKIKINKIKNLFWYYPSIMTSSKSKWASLPYKEIKELFFHNGLLNDDCIISINPDGYSSAFLFTQTYNDYKFFLNDKKFLEVKNCSDKNKVFGIEIINDNLKIIWTKKSLSKIMKGSVPFISKQYLINEFISEKIPVASIEWNGRYFDWYN